jgi:hypothetical protein
MSYLESTWHKMGLTETEINEIGERLWSEANIVGKTCPDCGVKPVNNIGKCADVSKASNCGIQ